jgi:tetratricopeptide (TPR) repeat protein
MSADPLSEQELDALNRLHKFAKTSNYYGILGISPGADASKIQAAYYQLSRDWHPDRHFRRKLGDDASRIEFVFVNITKAYKVLSDADARRRYHRDNKEIVALARAEEQDAERIARKKKARAKAKAEGEERPRKRKRTAEERASRERIARKRADPRARAIKQLREQVKGRSSRARRYFKQGQEDYDSGDIAKAVSSLHLAVQFDPQNAEYRALYELARSEASSSLSVQYIQAGESAESFQNYKEAMFNYERACEQNPEDGLPYYRLAMLMLKTGQEKRAALNHLRTAASKSPKNIEIRLSLADLYADLGMSLNAKREYQTVLGVDKNNTRARSGLRSVR